MRQITSYDDMFRTIRAFTVPNILKIRILSQKFLQNEVFSPFLSNDLILIVLRQKIQPYTLHCIICTAINVYFKENCLSSDKFKDIIK